LNPIERHAQLKHVLNTGLSTLIELSNEWDKLIGKGDWFAHEKEKLSECIKAIEERNYNLLEANKKKSDNYEPN